MGAKILSDYRLNATWKGNWKGFAAKPSLYHRKTLNYDSAKIQNDRIQRWISRSLKKIRNGDALVLQSYSGADKVEIRLVNGCFGWFVVLDGWSVSNRLFKRPLSCVVALVRWIFVDQMNRLRDATWPQGARCKRPRSDGSGLLSSNVNTSLAASTPDILESDILASDILTNDIFDRTC